MPYSFYRPSQHSIETSANPAGSLPRTSSTLSPVPACVQLGSSVVKEEAWSSGNDRLTRHSTRSAYDTSKKRQRTIRKGSSHKFVSQKKWNFSETQPWLQSRVSSKAQNASKGINRSMAVTIPPEPDTSDVPPEGQQTAARATHSHDTICSSKRASRSKEMTSRDSSAQQTTSGSRSPSPTASIALDEPDKRGCGLLYHSRNQRHQSRREIMGKIPSRLLQPHVKEGGISECSDTLSLEKDAERIARLIAEKKEENESSMFRERLVQRQLQHKSRQETESESSQSAEAQVSNLRESIPYLKDGREKLTKSRASSAETSNNLGSSRAMSSSSVPATQSLFAAKGGRTAHAPLTRRHTSQVTKSALSNQLSTREPWEIPMSRGNFFNGACYDDLSSRQVSESIVPSDWSSLFESDDWLDQTSMPYSGMPFFDIGDTDLSAQFGTSFQEGIPEYGSRGPQLQEFATQQLISRSYSRESDPNVTLQVQKIQRTLSSQSTNKSSSVEAPTSAHSPTSLASVQTQFGLPQASGYFSRYSSDPTPNGCTATRESRVPLCHAEADPVLNRQTRAGMQRHFDDSDSLRVTNDNLNTEPHSSNSAAKSLPKSKTRRRDSASYVNMFSGSTRSSTGNGMAVPSSKPRVNMFSNNKGLPIPVQEVIRQIEMI